MAPGRASRNALEGFLEPFRNSLHRTENLRAMDDYLQGLLSSAPRKNATGIADALGDTNAQRLQEFLTRTEWEARDLDRRRVEALGRLATRAPGILCLDVSSFAKRGSRSVGVAVQQLAGERARNQQVVSGLSYVDPVFEWPVTSDLLLPARWSDPGLRQVAGIPDVVDDEGLSQIGLRQVMDWSGHLPPTQLVRCGPDFADEDVTDHLSRTNRPWVAELPPGAGPPLPPTVRWMEVRWLDRATGPKVRSSAWIEGRGGAHFLALALPGRETRAESVRWLRVAPELDRQHVEDLLPLLDGGRRIDRRARQNFGMADYEGRLWSGFNRHLALVRLAAALDLLRSALD